MSNIILSKSDIATPLTKGRLLARGLVGYWRFGEGRGSILQDSSLEGNDGTITGAIWQGQGLIFDGDTDMVSISPVSIPNGVGDITITAIMNIPSAGEANNGRILEIDGRLLFFFETAGGGLNYRRNYSGGDALWRNGNASGLIGSRLHMALSVEKDNPPKLYINGALVYELPELTAPSGTITSIDGGNLRIFSNAASSRALGGTLEQCSFYTRALSADEIRVLSINPDLPIQQDPILLGFPQAVGDIVILRRRRECA